MRTFCFLTAFTFLSMFSFAQNEKYPFPPKDSLLKALQTEKIDSNRVNILIFLSRAYHFENAEKAYSYGQEGLRLAQKINYTKGQISCGVSLSSLLIEMNQHGKAIELLLKTNEISETFGNPVLQARVFMALGLAYGKLDYSKGLEYMLKSRDLIHQYHIPENTIPINLMIGFMYKDLGELDSALAYLHKNYQSSLRYSIRSVAATALAMGQVYDKMGNIPLAKSYFQSVLSFNNNHRLPISGEIYLEMGKNYWKSNQRDSAIYFAEKALAETQKHKSYTLIHQTAQLLFQAYEKTDARLALKYHIMASAAKDSLYNLDKFKEIGKYTFLEIIRQEHLRETQSQQALERSQHVQYVGITIFILTIIMVSVVLYKRQVNPTILEWIGVVSLLLLFEFLNIILEPSITKLSNRSPIITLLCLVTLASIVSPIHHFAETRVKTWVKGIRIKHHLNPNLDDGVNASEE
ncbi:tetratricopeptide repeat protein [Arcicella lustrica]|uniref:Tetratricopeptide repeat protein n=1 Tax=Arcicella lustrica TaxID=2984196 RepID=A0ABU5SIJ0_9BACT|nr:tetratricopeptide repeat protein [Arcicella sp. DC25W]MEA5427056.1 tetratricopeptide repeat protein [Arcicella sp. DC25W]